MFKKLYLTIAILILSISFIEAQYIESQQTAKKDAEESFIRAIEQDQTKALQCYQQGAQEGDIIAQIKLADMYVSNLDYKSALKWYHKAAQQEIEKADGNTLAQITLAKFYRSRGDFPNALIWYESVSKNNKRYFFILGILYLFQGNVSNTERCFNQYVTEFPEAEILCSSIINAVTHRNIENIVNVAYNLSSTTTDYASLICSIEYDIFRQKLRKFATQSLCSIL